MGTSTPDRPLAFGYVRISEDREGKELGVKRQKEDIRGLAERLGVEVVRFFKDNDISASTNTSEERPDYDEMMTLLASGPVRTVLAYTTSRLTRKPEETEHQIMLARRFGVQYFYVRGQALDLQVAANRRMARYQAANDAGEAEELQERIVRKKLADAREGRATGGRRTYGYGKAIGSEPATGKEVCDPYQVRPDEVAMLEEGKRRILAGDSQLAIVTDWNARGILTSLGFQWTVGKFKRTLMNESYVVFDPTGHPTSCPCLANPATGGTRIHHADRHRARWPAVFTGAEREAMAVMFNSRAQFWSHGPLKGRSYLLTGLTYCGGRWPDGERRGELCGGAMYGQGKTETGRYIRRYACRKWDAHGIRVGCCTVFRIADAVETLVGEAVLERFDSPEVARALAPAGDEGRMAEVLQRLSELQARREQLAAEYAVGLHERSDYQIMAATVRQRIAEADSERKQLLSEKARSLTLPADGGLRDVWATASMEWKHSVIRLLVERVVIHPGRPGGRRWKGWNFDPDLVEIVWLH